MITASTAVKPEACPLHAAATMTSEAFGHLRTSLLLNACKWDPQVGDVATISPFPILLSHKHWIELSSMARDLARELSAAETELLGSPDLHARLGMPRGLRSLFRNAPRLGPTPAAARVMRFDFHWTTDGWRISEVNSDVPGGFSEASALPSLMSASYPGTRLAGHPANAWADAIASKVDPGHRAALMAASGFMEDQQIMAYFAKLLNQRGIATVWTQPDQLSWRKGHAQLEPELDRKPSDPSAAPIGAIVRFYQAEWLNPRSSSMLFLGGRTPVCNPGSATLTESKRFPLVWDELSTPLPTWRRLLPSTVDPREADWRSDDSWLVKSAYCNTGDTVAIRSLLSPAQWRNAAFWVWLNPGSWIAQKRFEMLPIPSPDGPIYPCIGVYTIDGEPAGIYGRYSHKPLIDFASIDVAVLIADSIHA